ncbi:hypothetical protein LIER_37034 [Lithospermum erythrorhizon]|uniref:Uncharacterized protein n=1 Tax=Lithospermum erythrorhizon TaxID=34254 RepID=A0AAV3PIW4_LITER
MRGKSLKVYKFIGRNIFGLWKIKVRALLKREGIWAPLTKNKPISAPKNWYSLEEKAHSTLLLSLEDEIIMDVYEKETAAGLWPKLESLHITKSLRKSVCNQKLNQLVVVEATSVWAAYVGRYILKRTQTNYNVIIFEYIYVDDEHVALILLVSLPASYEKFKESMTNGKCWN